MVALGQGMERRKGRNGIEEKNIIKNILFFYSRKKTGSKDIKMLIFLEFMVSLIFLSTFLSLNIFELKK